MQDPLVVFQSDSQIQTGRVIPKQQNVVPVSSTGGLLDSVSLPPSSVESVLEGSVAQNDAAPLPNKNSKAAKSRGQKQAKLCPNPGLMINRAKKEDLESLPGIGPALAQRILEQRKVVGRFKSAEDLLEVPGIGVKKLNSLRGCVRFEP